MNLKNYYINSSRIKKLLYTLIIFFFSTSIVTSQTCSCGGPPLLGSLESSGVFYKSLQIGVTYEYSSISDLVNNTDKIDNQTRERDIKAALFQIDYGLTPQITLAASMSILEQRRTTLSETGVVENLNTRGVGDVLFLVKYSLKAPSIFNRISFSIGGGIKFPTGKSTLKNNNLLISADMQPGTGAIDGIIWSSYSQPILNTSNISLLGNLIYRFNGPNDRFGSNFDNYKFGNEFILNLGAGYNFSTNLGTTLFLRYRNSQADKFSDQSLPNSGGKWLNLVPGINASISPSITLRGSGQLPVYRELEGVQFSTSYSFSISLFYTFLNKGSPNDLL